MMWPTFSCVIFPLRSVRDFTRLIFHAARRVNTKSSRCERNPSSGEKTFRQDELHATFPLSGTIRWYSWNFRCEEEGKKGRRRRRRRRRRKKRTNERHGSNDRLIKQQQQRYYSRWKVYTNLMLVGYRINQGLLFVKYQISKMTLVQLLPIIAR